MRPFGPNRGCPRNCKRRAARQYATASVAFSLGFTCATPFAAFAALAALTLSRRDGLFLIAGTWLTNQVVGFGLLHYPWTIDCAGWGLCLGLVSVLAFIAAAFAADIARRLSSIAAFVAAFAVYEVALFLVSVLVQSGTGAFAPNIVRNIFAINAVAFVGLFVVDRLVARSVLDRMPVGHGVVPRRLA